MTNRLVEIDDDLLESARAALQTPTIKATVEEALRRVDSDREETVGAALSTLAGFNFEERDAGWR